MKYTTILVALFASAIAAGIVEPRGNKPPKCTMSCIKDNYKKSGCGKKDLKCMCQSEALYEAVVPCIKKKCKKKEDIKKSVEWVRESCSKLLGINEAEEQ